MRHLRILLGWTALGLAALLQARPFTVVTYNVENLFDLDGVAAYEAYESTKYTPAHALTKLQNIAKVVGKFENGRGPDILLLSEVEVDATPGRSPPDYDAILARYRGTRLEAMLGAGFSPEIADLPAEALLVKALADAGITGYRVVAGENVTLRSDERKQAIRCLVLTRFPVKQTRSHPTQNARPILEVQVDVDGAPLYLFANHWKSGAGDAATEPDRAANARTLRTRLEEILRDDPNADIIIGGDLNSQYNQKQRYPQMKETGINDVLGSQGNELAVRQPERPLYNLWFELPSEQRGSDTFRGEWGTLMHLLITRGLYDYHGVQYVDNSFTVAKFPGLNADGNGLPLPWHFEGNAGGGVSDHFPIAARFVTVTEGRKDRYLSLRNASDGKSSTTPRKTIDYAQMDVAKLAVRVAALPSGTKLQADEFKGKIFRVDGRVVAGTRLAVEFRGETFDVWSYDEALRTRLRAEHAEGAAIKFYGELGQYRGRWQFIVQDASWVK
jgi:endonuclease/exonuclease/phosphatase family metal-dependent hydrolase